MPIAFLFGNTGHELNLSPQATMLIKSVWRSPFWKSKGRLMAMLNEAEQKRRWGLFSVRGQQSDTGDQNCFIQHNYTTLLFPQ